MKIKAKIGFAGTNFSASSGQVLDLPEDVARDLINAGFAEYEGKSVAEVKDEDKRDNTGNDIKAAKGKRGSTKR